MKQLIIGLLFSMTLVLSGVVSLEKASAREGAEEVTIMVQDSVSGRVGFAIVTSEPSVSRTAWHRRYREAQEHSTLQCIGCPPEQDVQTIFDASPGTMTERLMASLREITGSMPHLEAQSALLFVSTPGEDPEVFVTAYEEADPILALERLLQLDRAL